MTDSERRQAVRDAVTRVAHSIDFRRWDALRALYAERVTTDYTSLFGGDPQEQPGDALIDGWRRMLSPLDATQHLLGPVDVRLQADAATAECHVRGYHFKTGAAGGDEWMVAGQWVIELMDRAGVWQITGMTLRTLYQTGNRDLLRQAAELA